MLCDTYSENVGGGIKKRPMGTIPAQDTAFMYYRVVVAIDVLKLGSFGSKLDPNCKKTRLFGIINQKIISSYYI